jgi:hypothetical protein
MATSPPPAWLSETLDVLERRSRLLRTVVVGTCLLGVLLALIAPGLVPPTPVMGAAVAVAAIVLGVAVVLAVDAGDSTVRAPRHVQSAGGELVGVLPRDVSADAASELATAVLAARPDRRLTIGLAGIARGASVPDWTDAVGVAIARQGASVLILDLASGATPADGVLEVVRDGRPLARAVTFEHDLKIARIGAGRDLDEAIEAAAVLPRRLPKDLEVLLVGLPPVTAPDVLETASSLDAVLLLATAGLTPRVRLEAALEALDSTDTPAQVVLVDDRAAAASTPRTAAATGTREVTGDAAPTDTTSASPATDDPAPPAAPPATPEVTETATFAGGVADGTVPSEPEEPQRGPADPLAEVAAAGPSPAVPGEHTGEATAVPPSDPTVTPEPRGDDAHVVDDAGIAPRASADALDPASAVRHGEDPAFGERDVPTAPADTAAEEETSDPLDHGFDDLDEFDDEGPAVRILDPSEIPARDDDVPRPTRETSYPTEPRWAQADELRRAPSPSVRIVRGASPTEPRPLRPAVSPLPNRPATPSDAPSTPLDADHAHEPTAGEHAPDLPAGGEDPRDASGDPAGPRPADVLEGAAAARVANRLEATARPGGPPEPIEPPQDAEVAASDADVSPTASGKDAPADADRTDELPLSRDGEPGADRDATAQMAIFDEDEDDEPGRG